MRIDEALDRPLIGEDSLTRECVLSVLHAADELRSRAAAIVRPFGVTLTGVELLAVLDAADQPETQSGIANCLGSDPSTVSWLVERLEVAGYVRRHRVRGDRRRVAVEINECGRAALADLRIELARLDLLVSECLSRAEQATLLHLVGGLARQLRFGPGDVVVPPASRRAGGP